MGCPGQARTKPRRNQPSQRCQRHRRTAAAAKYRTAAAAHRRAKRDARPRATSRVQRPTTARRAAVMLRNQCASRRPSSARDQKQRSASNRETVPSNRHDAAATMRDLHATRCTRPVPIDRAAALEAARTSRPPCAASAHVIARWGASMSGGAEANLKNFCPRPEGRLLHQPALEGLTRSARTDSPRKTDRSKSDQSTASGGDAWQPAAAERDKASRVPTTIAAPKSQFRTCPSDHGTSGNQAGPSGSSAGRSPRP
ncbi:putative sulfite oxidase [Dorcoceras hygrometricum]|uniref:Putative sulfite oxidase n=1 Tax=Dorcoceras hygrometricum TaxID=472368 RepID=A0A2Z7BQ04_9LAMI|nr:putative sulfite oxidase [Dorcoceras hygrometricum]